MKRLQVRKNPDVRIILCRALGLLEPKLSMETIMALSDEEIARLLFHYALHVDAMRNKE
jgi:hypothetical protein